jgi:predicted nucleic acid-binding protein
LRAEGFAVFDALHLSCAEAGQADVLLTTDDRFLRRAERLENMLQVKVVNPVRWLMEVTANAAE